MPLRTDRGKQPVRWGRVGLAALSLVAVGGASLLGLGFDASRSPAVTDNLPSAVARRVDLHATLNAPGQVNSSKNTIIECEIEATRYSNEGRSIYVKGSTTILSIVPDGSIVHAGDELCRLDSSDYEELVRQQSIELEESRAEYQGAELDLQADMIRLKEYEEGLLLQLKEQYQGKIVLAEAENRRQAERVTWTERMVDLKYLPLSRLALEKQNLQRTQIERNRALLALNNLVKFTGPKVIAGLEARLESRKSELNFRKLRLDQNVKQLAKFNEQVELCTVRAPHDGFLIYANDDDDEARIEQGATVRQRQDLFYLPDLTQMEVITSLHESIVRRVQEGMQALVKIEAMPHVRLEGTVVSVSPLPQSIRSWSQSNEVKNFIGKVQLNVIPQGLLPGMTAEVEIVTANVPNAVVVPPFAIMSEEGQSVCYVSGPSGLEKREIELGESTPDMIEVRRGVQEGEQVILYPESSLDNATRASLATTTITASSFSSSPPPLLADLQEPAL